MYICPSCGQVPESSDRFCTFCGAVLTPPAKKARWWPPVLALVLIFAIGLGVFFLFRPAPLVTTDASMPWFTVQDGVLCFDKTLYTGGSQLTVPSSIGGQPVTAISDSCFALCAEFTTIELPAGITRIGTDAFRGCINLRGIRLPETLRGIGNSVFAGCSSLEAICLPASLIQYGDDLFTQCDKLSYVFYSGSLAQWKALGIGQFAPGTILSCTDGLFQLN